VSTMFILVGVRMSLLSALFVLLMGQPGELLAQRVPRFGAGTHVRLLAPAIADTLLTGKVQLSSASATLMLRPSPNSSVLEVPHNAIIALEVNRRRSRWPIGMLLGGAIGSVSRYYAVGRETSCEIFCGAAKPMGAFGGALLGGLLGAAVGSSIKTGPDQWTPVPLSSIP
jgi:hypothetical protein